MEVAHSMKPDMVYISRSSSYSVNTSRKSRSVDRLPRPGKDRTKGTILEGLRPTVKKLEPEQQDQVEVAGDEEREERVFNPAGYEAHLIETIEKDILQRNPDVTWTKVAGLHEAKAILQEAMVLPILMPDFFKVLWFAAWSHILRSSLNSPN